LTSATLLAGWVPRCYGGYGKGEVRRRERERDFFEQMKRCEVFGCRKGEKLTVDQRNKHDILQSF
jgi:hypothetical protein